FPALNARNESELQSWLDSIKAGLQVADRAHFASPKTLPKPAPFAANLIAHKTNGRLKDQTKVLVRNKVPIIITSLGPSKDIVDAVHEYGGHVFHDVTNAVHAEKAAKAGVDGLIAICAGAGGHAGIATPFALIPRLRSVFDGVIIMGGAISDGRGIRAAQVLGADLAYMGTRFIPTTETASPTAYKQMLLSGSKTGPPPTFLPTIYTPHISGINANFLRESLEQNGIDSAALESGLRSEGLEGLGTEDWVKSSSSKVWKDLWSAGQGVINMCGDVKGVADVVDELEAEYHAALRMS
ncbi:hypothetical protein HDU93_000862, partial [Gonapodya sp. JEL0774]